MALTLGDSSMSVNVPWTLGLIKLVAGDRPGAISHLEDAARMAREAKLIAAEIGALVLLDIMMPILDGFGVLARLKADADTRDIPIIVISAMNDLASVVRGIKAGAEDYLPKPFDPVLLQARISASL
jgi:DNA-binding response OmpR family regulator